MIDYGDMLQRLKKLLNHTDLAAFMYYTADGSRLLMHWIIFMSNAVPSFLTKS